jgi:hypothetical protein
MLRLLLKPDKTEINDSRTHPAKHRLAVCAGAAVLIAVAGQTARAESSVAALLDNLQQNGVLTSDKAGELKAEFAAEMAAERTNLINELRTEFAAESAAEKTNILNELKAEFAAQETNIVNQLPASKWKLADSIKNIALYGDLRFRYEYRGVDNAPGISPNTYYRERMRYALRFGLRGDLVDDFSYGIRLETANNPRSPWDTFGNNTTAGSVTPSDKNSSGIFIGQAFLNWHPTSWFEVSVGRMPQPLYITPMVWDSDINPEGAFEKLKYTIGPVDLFADFGQFVYQNPTAANVSPSGDTFLLAWQAGANVRFGKTMSFKVAPVLYTYSGSGTSGGLNGTFVGQGTGVSNSVANAGLNVGVPGGSNVAGYNEQAINDLMVLEIPAELNFKIMKTPLGDLQGRLFGDFAYNFEAGERARRAYFANPLAFPTMNGPATGQDIAYQIGFGIGSAGPLYGPTQGVVYGSTSKKNTWEARVYWQHIEQYALDVNLIDSDFFEGRGNLQGIYLAFAYSFTDAIIGTMRYGYASRINNALGTGGNNLDIPGVNPIKNYNLVQMDVTWKF